MTDTIPAILPEERTFVSCHRYDPFRRFIIRILMPVVGIAALLGFLILTFFFYLSLGQHIPEEIRFQVFFMLGMVALMGMGMVVCFLALAWNLNRRFYRTSIQCDTHGLRYRSGQTQIAAPWESVRIGRVLELGRMQSAVVNTSNGRIRIDPSYVDESGPHPKVRVSFGKEFLLYPDGTRVPYKVRENELFRLIEERTGDSTRQSPVPVPGTHKA